MTSFLFHLFSHVVSLSMMVPLQGGNLQKTQTSAYKALLHLKKPSSSLLLEMNNIQSLQY